MKKNLFDILKGIKEFVKNRFWRFSSDKKPSRVHIFSGKNSKTCLTSNETLHISSVHKAEKTKLSEDASEIFKGLEGNPDKIIEFIKSCGTPVIKGAHLEKVLILLGETEGFILPMKGLRALFLSSMINLLSSDKVKTGFKTEGMFVMRNETLNVYFLAHQFHHWMSYTQGLPGYDSETSDIFKCLWSPEFSSNDIDTMSIEQIFSLKEAIARDLEAIEFVKNMCREVVGAKKSVNKLINGESLNL